MTGTGSETGFDGRRATSSAPSRRREGMRVLPGGELGLGTSDSPESWLARRYRAYRRRQGAALLGLIPREGIRPLYRAALKRATESGEVRGDPEDSFGLLADFCSALLPLPPFDVWCDDFTLHRAAHLDEADELGAEPREEPVTVELRSFEDETGEPWYASLDLRRSGGAWRGSVAFHPERGSRVHRTGEIFVESDATTVRARFLEFGLPTLRAFLRSVRP